MAMYRHTKTGRLLSSTQTLGYPWVSQDDLDSGEHETFEVVARTADAVMADVGDDAELAAAELAAEKARTDRKPRTTLIARLQAVIDAAEES